MAQRFGVPTSETDPQSDIKPTSQVSGIHGIFAFKDVCSPVFVPLPSPAYLAPALRADADKS